MFLGLDVSTTGVKAVLVDGDAIVKGSATAPHPLNTPHPLWSEQDPADWWSGAISSIREVMTTTGTDGDIIKGIGITGQMHGMTLLDERGRAIRPAILWNDQRTASECDEIRSRVGRDRLIGITGNDALTGFTAPKILWVRNHEADGHARIRQVLLPKDYVRYRLTGEYATDKAGAAGTLLVDLRERTWSEEILDALDLPHDWFPRMYEGPEVTGSLTEEAARLTGLRAGTPVVAGGGDQAAQAVGVGATEPGIAALTVGTSGVVFASTRNPVIEPEARLHSFCHAVPDLWHLMGVMLSAAGSLRWFRDTFAPEASFDELLVAVDAVPPGCEGLIFLPYLTGERTPHADPLARGAFVGLTTRHSRTHLVRAVLEGVAFGLRDSFELMKEAGVGGVQEVRLSGGGSRSGLWASIVSEVLGTRLVTVEEVEGAAFGAALLAGAGCGGWQGVSALPDTIGAGRLVEPDVSNVEAYADAYKQFGALYPKLANSFRRLATL